MKAQLSNSRGRYIATVIILLMVLWSAQHIIDIYKIGSIKEYLYSNWVFFFSFIMLIIAITFAYKEKPKTADENAKLDMFVTAVVPAYNEDPVVLKEVLESLVVQSRPLQEVYLVDDGSNKADYESVRIWFDEFAKEHDVEPHWITRENGGKRKAQSSAFYVADKAEIFITVDSDSVLDYNAIEEILKPFADERVQSVAGVILSRNNRTNLLARITDVLFVTGQLIDRSMMSSFGSVLVNSGGLAAYRAEIIRDNLDYYLSETFFGKHIEFSDDSMLTLYALQRGKTVQQPSAFVFAMMPDKVSHHIRQQVRWMRGSFIRSWWRLKYLPILSFGFARQAIGWMQFAMTSAFIILVIVINPHIHSAAIPYLILMPILVNYAQALRYFSIKRSDESIWSQVLSYSFTPLATIWSYLVLRPIRIYASLTCFNSSWGTRKTVEVTLDTNKVTAFEFAEFIRQRRFGVNFETYYESLGRAVCGSVTSRDIAEEIWFENYQLMSGRMRSRLWSGYEKYEIKKQKWGDRRVINVRLRPKPKFLRSTEPMRYIPLGSIGVLAILFLFVS